MLMNFLLRSQLKESSEISQKSLERGWGGELDTCLSSFTISVHGEETGWAAHGINRAATHKRDRQSLVIPFLFLSTIVCKAFPESLLPFSSFHPFTQTGCRGSPSLAQQRNVPSQQHSKLFQMVLRSSFFLAGLLAYSKLVQSSSELSCGGRHLHSGREVSHHAHAQTPQITRQIKLS